MIDDKKPISRKQFAQRVKEKYPEYKDVDDEILATKMLEKYPEYSSTVEADGAFKKYGQPKTFKARLKEWLSNIWSAITNFPTAYD